MGLPRSDLEKIADLVLAEVYEAESIFPAFNSAHEGYAVIKEELDELWAEIKKKSRQRDLSKMQREAIQVAAMGIRFCLNITFKGNLK